MTNQNLIRLKNLKARIVSRTDFEDIAVLEKAIYNGGNYAAYYLGCLFYDRGRWEESKELWEKCADNIKLPTVYRNLSLVY